MQFTYLTAKQHNQEKQQTLEHLLKHLTETGYRQIPCENPGKHANFDHSSFLTRKLVQRPPNRNHNNHHTLSKKDNKLLATHNPTQKQNPSSADPTKKKSAGNLPDMKYCKKTNPQIAQYICKAIFLKCQRGRHIGDYLIFKLTLLLGLLLKLLDGLDSELLPLPLPLSLRSNFLIPWT